jgi:hypothetical protein
MGQHRSLAAGPAHHLNEWFGCVVRVVDDAILAGEEGAHRNAAVLNVLTRHARRIREAEVDAEGALYTPLCLVLVAACRQLGLTLGPRHWEAAVAGVVSLSRQVAASRNGSARIGLELGTPANILKEQLDEALLHAGVAGVPTFLDREGRGIALGLAIHWAMRFLCAYAMECPGLRADPVRRDLAWIATLLRPLLDSSAAELPA